MSIREIGRQEGRQEGRLQQASVVVKNLARSGMLLSDIAKMVELSEPEAKAILAEQPVPGIAQ